MKGHHFPSTLLSALLSTREAGRAHPYYRFWPDYSVLWVRFILMRLSRLSSMKVLHTQEVRIYTSIMVGKQERVHRLCVTPAHPAVPSPLADQWCKALGEPAVDGCQQLVGLGTFTLLLQQPTQ